MQIADNTMKEKLTREFIESQIEAIALVEHMLKKTEYFHKDSYVGKFTFEISYQDESVMYNIIKDNAIGNEYIFLNDGYRLVTDQAIYMGSGYITSSNSKLTRYAYSEYDEIVATQTCDTFAFTSKKGFFTTRDGKTEMHITSGEDGDFIKTIGMITTILEKKGNYKKVLYGRNYVYCTACRKFSFVDNAKELKKCPNCQKKLEKFGWMDYLNGWFLNSYESYNGEERKGVEKRIANLLTVANSKILSKSTTSDSVHEEMTTHDEKEINITVDAAVDRILYIINKYIELHPELELSDVLEKFLFKHNIKIPSMNENAKETMYCTSCGKQILRTVKFCNFCGAKVNYKG